MIIVYGFDERLQTPVAKQFHEKGFENTFLVSGGIEQFLQDFPDLVEGKHIPDLVSEKKAKKK